MPSSFDAQKYLIFTHTANIFDIYVVVVKKPNLKAKAQTPA
jgi:hypothetical protein